jgi:hypothetical protein
VRLGRGTFLAGLLAVFVGVVLVLSLYGPSRRTFLVPPRAIAVATTAELLSFCQERGLRGRRAVVFARRLIQAEDPSGDPPDIQPLTELMHRGVVRELFHVVPEQAWPEVTWNLANVSIFRVEGRGRVANFEDGRINVDRLAGFWPKREPALLLLDPRDWSPDELQVIAGLVRSGRLRTDLIAVLRGTAADLALWSAIMSSIRA